MAKPIGGFSASLINNDAGGFQVILKCVAPPPCKKPWANDDFDGGCTECNVLLVWSDNLNMYLPQKICRCKYQ